MSAAELATVVEGWATLAGLMVVVAGATFAGVQLRRDSKSRRLQALVDLYSVIWPKEMPAAVASLLSLRSCTPANTAPAATTINPTSVAHPSTTVASSAASMTHLPRFEMAGG